MANGSTGRVEFPSTHWSVVDGAAAGGDGLQALLRRYQPAMRAYLQQTLRVPSRDLDDLLQSFIADKLVAESAIAHADRRRGRFRTFLLSVLKNYASNVRRARRSERRSGDDLAVSLDDRHVPERRQPTGEELFDIDWARSLLDAALGRMRQACEGEGGRREIWMILDRRVVQPALTGEPPPSYADLLQNLGLDSATTAHNLLVTAKRMFERSLRETIGEYARDEAEIDEELRDLRRILARARA